MVQPALIVITEFDFYFTLLSGVLSDTFKRYKSKSKILINSPGFKPSKVLNSSIFLKAFFHQVSDEIVYLFKIGDMTNAVIVVFWMPYLLLVVS